MAFLGKIAKFVLGGGLLGVGIRALTKKKPTAQVQPPAMLPTATRDDARGMIDREDGLRRRKGSAADMILNGSTGAEAAIAPGRLVLGN